MGVIEGLFAGCDFESMESCRGYFVPEGIAIVQCGRAHVLAEVDEPLLVHEESRIAPPRSEVPPCVFRTVEGVRVTHSMRVRTRRQRN